MTFPKFCGIIFKEVKLGIRDVELKRLLSYAQALNIKVIFKPFIPYSDAAAHWAIDGSEIIVHKRTQESKISVILSLIHELGHQLEFIHHHNRKPSIPLAIALNNDELKKQRKIVVDYEVKSATWWEAIYKECDMKFPLYKLHFQKEFDIWQYEVYYENGDFPTRTMQRAKIKELNKKWRKK